MDAKLLHTEISLLRQDAGEYCKDIQQSEDEMLVQNMLALYLEGKNGALLKLVNEEILKGLFGASPEYGQSVSSIIAKYVAEIQSTSAQMVLLVTAVACLEAFVQANWLGPYPDAELNEICNAQSHDKQFQDQLREDMVLDGDLFHNAAKCAILLFVARKILIENALLNDCSTCDLWQLRCIQVHQAMLSERSPQLKTVAMNTMERIQNNVIIRDNNYSDIELQFHLEAGHLCFFYYEPKEAEKHFQTAEKLSGLNIKLTGELGKKTRFQQKEIAQLMLEVTVCEDIAQPWTPENRESNFPSNVSLDDDTVLNETKLSDPNKMLVFEMSPIQQALVLGLCYNNRRMKEISPIVQEESEAYINAVIKKPQAWSVQLKALLLRSQGEWTATRKVQRAMSQLEELIKQYRQQKTAINGRIALFYCVNMPPIWEIECQLAELFENVGAIQAALEVYLRIENWEEVIKCYSKLGKVEKADKLIRQQLAIEEKPILWCYMGDIHNDASYYEKSWELSKNRFGRAMRSLAILYIHQKKYEQALECFEKSVRLNGLQIGTWFSYGCTALQIQNFEVAARAFRSCVDLDGDNFEAWCNLATAYIKMKQKTRAFFVLQEAIRCSYENWRLWENYLLVSTDIGEFAEVMAAYNRLLDLKDKYCDVDVLKVLVHAIKAGIKDASGEHSISHKPKALTLFGRITSKVTSNADVWKLYGELCLVSLEDVTLSDKEKALQFFQRSLRCASQAPSWDRDIEKCVEILQQSTELAKMYLDFVGKLENPVEIRRLLVGVKLMVNSVLARVRKAQLDCSGQLLEKVMQPIDDLEQEIVVLDKHLADK